ncbi:MAG: hypothetical protein PUA75_08665, partial [Clostridiales bacterium]|nr:hypothetical protein [Clostridiales bacterium]
MLNRKISKRKITAVVAVLLCAIMMFGQAFSVWGAEAQRSTSKNPISPIMTNGDVLQGAFVGRYQFNYTGNKNYYQYLQPGAAVSGVGNTISGKRKTAAKNALGQTITNSSSATLKKNGGNGNIKAAYLVWQTR